MQLVSTRTMHGKIGKINRFEAAMSESKWYCPYCGKKAQAISQPVCVHPKPYGGLTQVLMHRDLFLPVSKFYQYKARKFE
jgi:hypothetical protein